MFPFIMLLRMIIMLIPICSSQYWWLLMVNMSCLPSMVNLTWKKPWTSLALFLLVQLWQGNDSVSKASIYIIICFFHHILIIMAVQAGSSSVMDSTERGWCIIRARIARKVLLIAASMNDKECPVLPFIFKKGSLKTWDTKM